VKAFQKYEAYMKGDKHIWVSSDSFETTYLETFVQNVHKPYRMESMPNLYLLIGDRTATSIRTGVKAALKTAAVWIKKILFILLLLTTTLTYASEKTEWTYAFYLASGKRFYREQNNNYLEICKGAKNVRNGKVVVFIDVEPEKGKISILRLKEGTYAFEVKSCAEAKQLHIPSIGLSKRTSINLDASAPDVIKGFFDYVKENYSSRKYFYSIVAHGDAPIRLTPEDINSKSISKALIGNKADVLALDMCYMGGLESLWDLRNSGTFIVAASTRIPLSVNDYTNFLKKAGLENHTPADMAADFVAAYREKYAENRYPISLFALETGDRFESFVSIFNQRASGFSKNLVKFDRIKPIQRAKSNLYGINTDLIKGLEIIDTSLLMKLKPCVISSFSVNTDFTGPALFLPKNRKTYEKHRTEYRATNFSKDNPNWTKFLDLLYEHQ
jgi:Clostripain family